MHKVVKADQNGVVYTPISVADEVNRIGLECFSTTDLEVLEPSAGEGAFLSSLLSKGVKEKNITAVDIEEHSVKQLQHKFCYATIVQSDFLSFFLKSESRIYDLIVGNPPFIKRVLYTDQFRELLQNLKARTDFPSGELKNAWAAFVVCATKLVKENGVLAFILPYELITVNYGRSVQKYLLENRFDIEIFIPDEKPFNLIDQDAVILLAKRGFRTGERFLINRVASLSKVKPTRSCVVSFDDDRKAAIDMKSVLLNSETVTLLDKLRREMRTIHDYCDSVPGIVTAANKYFILRSLEAERLGLTPWTRKILKKSSYLPASPVFSQEDFRRIAESEPCELIDFFGNKVPPLSGAAKDFIQRCENDQVHTRYKCSRRKPWYRIPIVPAADGLFFKRAYIFPRLCVNDAGALVTDTAYQIRMKEGRCIKDLCFSFYNSITLLFAEIEGRFYGGGVLELTPVEFRNLPVHLLTESGDEFKMLSEDFPKSSASENVEFSLGDDRTRRALQVTDEQMLKIQTALKVVREHRLRHTGFTTR